MTDDQRWDALTRRDASVSFLYGVRTTGVYCRPACPSRLPRRANVEFFADEGDALRHGYRACKKCGAKTREVDLVLAACRLIDASARPPSLTQLAQAAGLRPSRFHRLFKEAVGVTPRAYAAARQTERFRDGLVARGSVTEAILDAGFGSSSRCYEDVASHLGMTPTEFQGGGAGQGIAWAVAACWLGWVIVAATERGLCLIALGDEPEALRDEARTRFPLAKWHPGDPAFADQVARVVALINAPAGACELPLDIQGTAFQRRVWEALRAIPPGATATYGQIAARIGEPGAARAVGRACGANPLAVAIPCHRVVRGDGELNGYRWGVARKRRLLDRERE